MTAIYALLWLCTGASFATAATLAILDPISPLVGLALAAGLAFAFPICVMETES